MGGTDIARAVLRGERKLTTVEITRQQFIKAPSGNFYTLLSDRQARNWLMKRAGKSKEEARQLVKVVRSMASQDGVPDNTLIFADVLPGCLFKRDIPKMGPCHEDFQYLQDWKFVDPPTECCLVFWSPCPIPGSTEKNYEEQVAIVKARGVAAGLPDWCDFTPGSVGHIAGISLAHFKAMGEDSFSGLVVRTSTCNADGRRLDLSWDGGGLDCDDWVWGGRPRSVIAVFGLGVVKALGSSDIRLSR